MSLVYVGAEAGLTRLPVVTAETGTDVAAGTEAAFLAAELPDAEVQDAEKGQTYSICA